MEELEAWQNSAVGNIQRLQEISTNATANLSKVLAQISDKVDSAPELRQVLIELVAMRDELAELAGMRNKTSMIAPVSKSRFLRATDLGQPPGPLSILELRGLGKELWQGIDPVEHVRSERDSWDS